MKKALSRFIGKVKAQSLTNKQTGEAFTKLKVMINNPNQTITKSDGSSAPNQYNEGMLVWFDNNGGQYQILGMDVTNVAEHDAEKGFTNSLRIDLDSKYHVKKLN